MISVIVPVYNEQENLKLLHDELVRALLLSKLEWEIIYVDDKSTDGSLDLLHHLGGVRTKVLSLARHYGQTIAIAAGIDNSKGDLVGCIDADLQYDPNEILQLLIQLLDEKYDMVVGWRKNRKDTLVTKIIPSYLGNRLIRFVTGVRIHDTGCGLKVFKKDIMKEMLFYGEMHRLLPIHAAVNGARVGEKIISHNERIRGKSKYGLTRSIKLLLDLTTLILTQTFYTKPIYFFGSFGILFMLIGIILGIFVIIRRMVFGGIWLSPMTLILLMFFFTGIQMIFTGILSELIVRLSFRKSSSLPYIINH